MPSKEVFIPKKKRERKGVNVATILGHKKTNGEVGIEIEVEGTKLPTSDTPTPWKYVEDHSLRPPNEPGGMTAEYVLKTPLPFEKVPPALKVLWDVFKAKSSKLVDSNRTSVHVHLNCQEWFLNRLTSFCCLYFIVEEVLTEWCGDHRVGNLFCLRAKDAEAIVTYLRAFIEADGQAPIQEFLHYSALNANALKKFGSLELRTLQGCSDPKVIVDWIETLERLYKLSESYDDPRNICTSLSSVGPMAFFDNILGPKAKVIRQGVSMTDNEIAGSVYEGVRIAQDLAYCRDWDLFKPMQLKPDVFGRPLGRVAQKLINNPPISPADAESGLLNILNNSSGPQPSPQPVDPYEAYLDSLEEAEPDYDDMDDYEGN